MKWRRAIFTAVAAPVWVPMFLIGLLCSWGTVALEAVTLVCAQLLTRMASVAESLDEPREGKQ